jgi:uncharacterized protein with ParB-like and HNH nuclease domain
MAKIENHKYTVVDAFTQCFYIVPDYQREYVWKEKEVQQLLDDIDEQLDGDSKREYFMGMVLVTPTDQNGHYEVIDGQQRLTTFFLMLCALRNLLKSDAQLHAMISNLLAFSFVNSSGDIEKRLKLDPRYEDAGKVVKLIAETDADPEATRAAIRGAGIQKFGSLDNLLNAYATLHRDLQKEYTTPAELKKFWAYIANSVIFIQITSDISSALKIFETINERGVGLNPMDLLKNLLFTQVRQEEFTRLKNEWKKITKPLEKAREKPLRFLRYFIMANYEFVIKRGEKRSADSVVREDEIYDWFTNKDNAAICQYREKPFEFVGEITRNVEHYLNFIKGLRNDGAHSAAMEDLRALTGGAFSLHYVLLLAASPLPVSLFDHFVRQLESFLFYYIFTKTPTKDLEKDFSVWADEIRAISQKKNRAEQENYLNAFINNRFNKGMKARETELGDALRRYTLNSMQRYRTNYLLAKIARHVEMAFKGIKTCPPLRDFTSLEIEHILPNNPTSELLEAFNKKHPSKDYNGEKNRLGNLTLLEKPHNIVAGNDFFQKKKSLYAKSANYLTRSIGKLADVGRNTSITRINKKLESYDQWNIQSIDRRQAILSDLVKDIWKIEDI